jgi:hypothetical protein
MKSKSTVIGVAAALMLIVPSANVAFGAEGGLGRPISGASINPYAGLVPPLPGFSVGVTEAYYDASIGGGTTVPVGINLTLGIDLKVSFTPISIVYIWPTKSKEWNFASAINIPLAYVEAKATVTIGPLTGQVKDHDFGLFDIVIVPIIASYHISETDHLAFNFAVWAPTGAYDKNRLANLSTNTWTFIPGVAYTKIFPTANIELSAAWSLQFDTENTATHYQNGVLSDLEATAIKRFKSDFGIGVIGSWIQQLNDDGGTTADRLNGFAGRAFGVGPVVTYSTKVGKSLVDFNGRWVHEFDNHNRPEGDLFQLSANLKF